MDVTPQLTEGAPVIQKYGNGGFVVNGERVDSSISLTATSVTTLSIASIPELKQKHVTFLDGEDVPELVLIGSGMQTEMLPADIRQLFESKQIGFDVMDTGAACRTFNVLLAEDRKVAAILIAV